MDAGDVVRIPRMPAWLLCGLPEDERVVLEALAGRPLRIREFDAFGDVWFGEDGPWFCVRPDDIVRDGIPQEPTP